MKMNAVTFLLILSARVLIAQQFFENITTVAKINSPFKTNSVSFNDFDNDSKPDILVIHTTGSQFYKNNGDLTFTLVPALNSLPNVVSEGALLVGITGDYNNDGNLDIFIGGEHLGTKNSFLFKNDGKGVFTEVSDIGTLTSRVSASSWLDFDNDGNLDLFLGTVGESSNILLKNLGNNTFANYTANTLLTGLFSDTRGIATGDFDRDGDIDVFVPNTGPTPNYLFRNDGNKFSEIAASLHLDFPPEDCHGAEFVDYNNDGYLDLLFGTSSWVLHLMKNNNGTSFLGVTALSGLITTTSGFRGSSFNDFDNDGDLDVILLTNNDGKRTSFYLNDGDGHFTDATLQSALDITSQVHTLAASDFDNDGKVDIYIGSYERPGVDQLYRNIAVAGNWLKVKVNGTSSNRAGIGAWLTLTANSKKQYRQITSGKGYRSQDDLTQHFGLGDAKIVDSLKIEWSSGIAQIFTNISANQTLVVTESSSLPAVPQNLRATTSDKQVILSWDANTGADFLRYRIYGGTIVNPTTTIDSVDGVANTNKTIVNLSNGTTYYFRLTAVNKALQASGYSNEVSAIPSAEDKNPPILSVVSYAQKVNLNTETPVSLSITDVSSIKNTTLYYRIAGATSFSSQAMSLQNGSIYTQTIPAEMATNRGAEFYVTAQDQYNNTAKSRVYPLRVYCPNGVANPAAQPSGNEAGAYRLFSVPLDLDNKSPAAFLNANASLGDYDNTKLRWFGVERPTQLLKEYPNFGSLQMSPDMGFALLTTLRNVKLKTGSGTTVVTTAPYNIALPAGWSLIGNPFNYNIPFDSLRVSNGTFELWGFEGDWQINTHGLEPWKGYAIWLSQAATFSIRAGLAGLKSTASFYSVENNDAKNWLIQITAENGHNISRFNFVGQNELASDKEDQFDLHQPLGFVDDVELVFNEQLTADIRRSSANGHTWELACALNPADEMLSLAFEGIQSVPPSFEIFLIDRETQTAYDLRHNQRLQFATRHLAEKRFQLIAGTKAYLNSQNLEAELQPTNHVLLQNFPNPFNPSTQIIYSLPEASHVEVSVYNLRGEAVATLVNENQEMGSHTVVWNAEKTGSGVYLIRIRAGRFESIKKCLFVK